LTPNVSGSNPTYRHRKSNRHHDPRLPFPVEQLSPNCTYEELQNRRTMTGRCVAFAKAIAAGHHFWDRQKWWTKLCYREAH